MKIVRNILKAGVLAAGLTLAVTSASASQLRLDLPTASRWGATVLPAGQYLVTYSAGNPMLRLTGNGKDVTVLIGMTLNTQTPKSNIEIKPVNGVPMVTSFTANSVGKTFLLAKPRTHTTVAF